MPDRLKKFAEIFLKGGECDVRFNEPMSEHTTFRVGGPADCYIRPLGGHFPDIAFSLLQKAKKERIPVFMLGGGANLVVSDRGIRGVVLDTTGWNGEASPFTGTLCLASGTSIDNAANIALEKELCGMEFLAGMPGTIGGALWMNARCYGHEIADILLQAEIIDFSREPQRLTIMANKQEFGYKKSPFQKKQCLILSASFTLDHGDGAETRAQMEKNRKDRNEKGHYLYPCAGSAFKNNRDFGRSTGMIIDGLGLLGYRLGGAEIAPFHGNIIINRGNATAWDIRNLVNVVSEKVREKTGFILESEILFVGDWHVDNGM
jgi:UDP-N-acetylmuramate dehydrogenase